MHNFQTIDTNNLYLIKLTIRLRKLTRCRVTVLPMYTQFPEDQHVQPRIQQLEGIDQSPVIKIKQTFIGKVYIMVALYTVLILVFRLT